MQLQNSNQNGALLKLLFVKRSHSCAAFNIMTKIIERFSTEKESKVILRFLWFCIASLCDCFKYLTRVARARFPALGAGYVRLLRFLIGSLDCLRVFRLARVITLVLVFDNQLKTACT